MLSPVIRTILLLSLEFRNTDKSVNQSTGQCQPVHMIYAKNNSGQQCSSSKSNRICRFFSRFLIFDLLGGYEPGV